MSNYETVQKKRNITVGIFVLIALCSLIWLIYKFGDLPTTVSKIGSFEVVVRFPTAQGVQKDTPVRFCGYKIGRVTEVRPPTILADLNTIAAYHQKAGKKPVIVEGINTIKYHQTEAVLNISKRYDSIPSNVDVKLMTRGLGSSYIELKVEPTRLLIRRDPNEPKTRFLMDKMLLQGSAGMTSEFFPEESQKRLDELAEGLRTLVKNTNDIIGDEANKENLKSTLQNLSEATRQATKTLKAFEEFSTAGKTTLEHTDNRLESAVVAMVETSGQLSKTVAELRLIFEKVNRGEGSAGKLVNDGRLYENLLENTQQLQVLLQELREFIAEYRKKGIKIKL